jgi:hypothetical protein
MLYIIMSSTAQHLQVITLNRNVLLQTVHNVRLRIKRKIFMETELYHRRTTRTTIPTMLIAIGAYQHLMG